jgi:hypothetical protein
MDKLWSTNLGLVSAFGFLSKFRIVIRIGPSSVGTLARFGLLLFEQLSEEWTISRLGKL